MAAVPGKFDEDHIPGLFLMNAPGQTKKVADVEKLCRVKVTTHIVYGGITVAPREGNTGGTNFAKREDGTSSNSLGLPCDGAAYLLEHGREMVRMAHEAGKKFVVNIAGDTPEEYAELYRICILIGADAVDVNTSCGNTVDKDNKRKPMVCYSRPLLLAVMKELTQIKLSAAGAVPEIWLKVAQYPNEADIEWVVDELWRNGLFDVLVCANAYPRTSLYYEKDDEPLLTVTNNYGGMGGTGVHDINVSLARLFREHAPDMPIIGVGGIDSGKTLNHYVKLANVIGAMIGTAFFGTNGDHDYRIFEQVADQYMELAGLIPA